MAPARLRPGDAVDFWDTDQSPGLGGLRAVQQRHRLARPRARPLHRDRAERPRLRPDGRRRLPHTVSAQRPRERILDAAVQRIASDGIDAVRIARIAMDARRIDRAGPLPLRHPRGPAGGGARALVRPGRRGDHGGGPPSLLRRWSSQCLPLPGEQERDWVLWVELWLRAVRHRSCARPRRSSTRGCTTGPRGDREGDRRVRRRRRRVADRMLALIDGFGVRALLGDPAMPLSGRARRSGTHSRGTSACTPVPPAARFAESPFG